MKIRIRFFTLFALAALITASFGTVFAQGPLPPADNDAWSLPRKAISGLQMEGATDSPYLNPGEAQATAMDAIRNGNFEQGRGVSWAEYSTHGYQLVLTAANLPLTPHSGTYATWLGGDDSETSYIIQYGVPVHKPATVLHFWYFAASQETVCGNDTAGVYVNNAKVYSWDLCDAHDSTVWSEVTVDLSAYDGLAIPLSFMVVTNGSVNSNLFIDDVSMTGGSFTDVSPLHPYFGDIEILYANGLTGGCSTSPLKFCPDQYMNRGEAAVFNLRANFGSSYVPPVPTHVFKDDWTKGAWAETWAEGMYYGGLSGGCQTNPPKYCPWAQIPREQAVIFALRMKYGTNYTPPAATGTLFADMTDTNYYATAWAEQAYNDGIIPKCGTAASGKPNFCPKDLVSRGLAAYMIVRAKALKMP